MLGPEEPGTGEVSDELRSGGAAGGAPRPQRLTAGTVLPAPGDPAGQQDVTAARAVGVRGAADHAHHRGRLAVRGLLQLPWGERKSRER
ncbi:hypothetical protein GCM10023108_21660 [Saccharopolyspora hordei]